MREEDSDFQELWDEYEWERFLQQQDRNTEKYLGLIDKYSDHPDRDRLIAQEMGWSQFSEPSEEEEADWEAAFEEFVEDEFEEEEEEDEPDFTDTPLYQETIELHRWIADLFEKDGELENHPDAVRLATSSALCSAKIAAAFSGTESGELGMTIAYLKRGLKATNDALEAGASLSADLKLTRKQLGALNKRLFGIRDTIVDLMGEFRAEFRRRRGGA